MKQGLSLRVSQHLALTPQLQQSIRLLQLSTLELGQEIQQMLDDNPFLEMNVEDGADEFGSSHSDLKPATDDHDSDPVALAGNGHDTSPSSASESSSSSSSESEPVDGGDSSEPNWDGDGSTETVADDGEWGGDAPAKRNTQGDDDEVDATDL